jgi:putative (di)nucleoside polyphosphate hydrolase
MSFDHLPYRPCAGFMLVNADGLVFVGERIDASAHGFWQMPQGGIDPGEDVRAAALRELHEETGVGPDLVAIIAQGSRPFLYDLPPEERVRIW